MSNPFRLKSSMFSRSDDNLEISPVRVVFLSVEGKTESCYLQAVNKHRRELGIRSVVQLEILQKNDTNSSVAGISALLEEYMEVRQEGVIPEKVKSELTDKFTDEFVEAYVNQSDVLEDNDREVFQQFLQQARLDIAYRKYLSKFQGEDDYFGVVVDRDCQSHTPKQMKDLIDLCNHKGYQCFLTNPCFDFWLLLHLHDGVEFVKNHKEDILEK